MFLLVSVGLLADAHAVDEGDEECDKSEDKDNDANIPDYRWICELEDDDEPNANENEGEVGENHQAANTLGVGAERIGG